MKTGLKNIEGKFLSLDLGGTKNHAKMVAAQVKTPVLILLLGDLGAGKTEWVRSFIRVYLRQPKLVVSSPSYSLVNRYSSGRKSVVHADLYRVSANDDLESIGFWDFFDKKSVICVEWSKDITQWPPEYTVFSIEIKNVGRKNLRDLSCCLVQRSS